jgi:hypothetical protein
VGVRERDPVSRADRFEAVIALKRFKKAKRLERARNGQWVVATTNAGKRMPKHREVEACVVRDAPPIEDKRAGDRRCSGARLRNRERHENRIHHLPGPLVVPLAVALALEAELLVQLDRGLVPREHVQLELAHA